MLGTMKYLGAPIMMAAAFCPVVHAEGDPRCSKPSDVYKEPTPRCSHNKETTTELERAINKCRKEIVPVKEGFSEFISKSAVFLRDTWCTIGANIDYLRTAPAEVQVGAIAVGALAGSLLAIRRGRFRKLTYGTFGGLTTAAVIYPDEARELASAGFQLAKCYGSIAYNFMMGPCKEKGRKDC